jgi:hypothetical protein
MALDALHGISLQSAKNQAKECTRKTCRRRKKAAQMNDANLVSEANMRSSFEGLSANTLKQTETEQT